MSEERWYTASELAGLPGMPGTVQGVRLRAKQEKWVSRKRGGRGGGYEHAVSNLPEETRSHLAAQHLREEASSGDEAAQAGAAAGRRLQIQRVVAQTARQHALESGAARLASLQGRDRRRAEARLALLSQLDRYIANARLSTSKGIQAFVTRYNAGEIEAPGWVRDEIPDVSTASIYRWRRRLNEHGAAELAGRYGNRRGSGAIDRQDELRRFVESMITEHDASPKQIWQAMRARYAERNDIRLPSQRSLQRWVNRWRRQHQATYEAARNPDAWKSRYMTAFGSYSAGVERLNALWELDSTPADVMLTDGRHHLIGAIDVYSRRAMLLVTPVSKAEAIGTLTRRAIIEWGVPETVKTDEGADYTSYQYASVLQALGVEQRTCTPFAPWEKPHVERFFRTFQHDLVELLPGYVGHDVAERQALEARSAFSERLFKKDEAVEVRMSAAELQEFCDRWVRDVYEHNPHEGLGGQTPFQVAAASRDTVRTISDERALDVLLAEVGERTVTKKGVRIDRGLYVHPDLALHVGERVTVRRDPTDLGRIWVFGGADNDFICEAVDPEVVGVDRQEIAAEARQRQKARTQEARRELRRSARQQSTREIAHEILDSRAREAGRVSAFPTPSETHTTPEIEAAGRAARTDEPPQPEETERTAAAARHAAEVVSLDAQRTAEPDPAEMNNAERYRYWCELDRRLSAGEPISSDARAFYESFRNSPTWRAFREMEQDLAIGSGQE